MADWLVGWMVSQSFVQAISHQVIGWSISLLVDQSVSQWNCKHYFVSTSVQHKYWYMNYRGFSFMDNYSSLIPRYVYVMHKSHRCTSIWVRSLISDLDLSRLEAAILDYHFSFIQNMSYKFSLMHDTPYIH